MAEKQVITQISVSSSMKYAAIRRGATTRFYNEPTQSSLARLSDAVSWLVFDKKVSVSPHIGKGSFGWMTIPKEELI